MTTQLARGDGFLYEGKVNGQAVRFALDTGCSFPAVLFRPAAERLELKLKAPQVGTFNGRSLPYQFTEECRLDLPDWGYWSIFHFPVHLAIQTPLLLLGTPDLALPAPDPEIHGVLGWPAIQGAIVQLDANQERLKFLKWVPPTARGWTRLPIRRTVKPKNGFGWTWHIPLTKRVVTYPDVLELELSDAGCSNERLMVDTGNFESLGLVLGPAKWREWRASHPDQATVLCAAFGADGRVMVRETAWAGELHLGRLSLTNVVIAQDELNPDTVATIGLEGLKSFQLILDGRHGVAYLRHQARAGAPPRLEGAGAIFAPSTFQTNDTTAHVLDHSPAFAAGIRNGDRLLQVDGRDLEAWRKNPGEKWRPKSPGSSLLLAAANSGKSTIELTLQRDTKVFKTTVEQAGVGIISTSR